MRFDPDLQRYEYSRDIYLFRTKKAMLNHIDKQVSQTWQDQFVNEVNKEVYHDCEHVNFTYNWTNKDGLKRTQKMRLICRKIEVTK